MGDLKPKDKKGIGNLDDLGLPFNYSEREYGTVEIDETRARFQWVSEVAYKNVHRIVSRGYDTTELMEEGYGMTDVLFVDFQARIPSVEEDQMLNYVMIMALEDGLSAPAAMSRLVAQSKTFLTQACGASIHAFGHAYGAYSAFGNRLLDELKNGNENGQDMNVIAQDIVDNNLDDESLGVSNLMLKDPAAKRMIARAEKLGVAGEYITLMKLIVEKAQAASDEPIDIDMLGAMGSVMMDLGFTAEATWAILAVTRSFAAGAHFIEEIERNEYRKLGQVLTPKEMYDGEADRPVPPLAEREANSKPALSTNLDEWAKAEEGLKSVWGSGASIHEEIEDPSKKTGIKSVGKKI
jgi:citrate synthase